VVSPNQRRQAVRHLQETFGVSQRRACRVLGQPRSTQMRQPKPNEEETRLLARMLELVRLHPRYGYRRIWALLRREGWQVNRKRIYRLWRKQGWKVPRKQRKKRRLAPDANSCVRRPAEYRNHVWTWDFLHDRTSDGGPLKWFTLVDEYTRECLALEVRRGMTSMAVSAVLAGVVGERGAPAHIRSDNGQEFIAQAIRAWMAGAKVETLYIDPGAPWENGYAESFNSKVRDELLNAEEFTNLPEARTLAQEWKQEYNHVRPHSSLGYRTPAEFASMCLRVDHATVRQPEGTTVTIILTISAPGT
jgi:putative transposase